MQRDEQQTWQGLERNTQINQLTFQLDRQHGDQGTQMLHLIHISRYLCTLNTMFKHNMLHNHAEVLWENNELLVGRFLFNMMDQGCIIMVKRLIILLKKYNHNYCLFLFFYISLKLLHFHLAQIKRMSAHMVSLQI